MIAEKISRNIYARRKALGLTQDEAAKRSNLSLRSYAKVERGKTNATLETLEKICQGLEMDAADLLYMGPK